MDDQTQTPGKLTPDAANTANTANADVPYPDAPSTSTPDMDAEKPESGAVPPGYDWPTHGGYLGCLLGMMPACLVGGFLGSTFVAWLNKAGLVHPVVAGILVVVLFVACMIGFGRLGWILGRRFYRKYPRGEVSWGEDDVVAGISAPGQQGDMGDIAGQTSERATP